jgi:hypothetical protein
MDKITPRLALFLGLFSGVCISAAWISARPTEIVGAVSIGAAVCATMLIVLRFDRALIKRNRRSSDNAKSRVKNAVEPA